MAARLRKSCSSSSARSEIEHAVGGALKRARRWILGIAISCAALVIAFWGARPERIAAILSQANYGFIIPVALAAILGLIAKSRSWQILLGNRITLRRSFEVINEGYLLNNILPFRLGELGRVLIVSQDTQLGAGSVFATIVLERLLDTMISFTGLLFALPFIIRPSWTNELVIIVAGVLFLVCLILGLFIIKRRRMIALLGMLPGKGLWGLENTADDFLFSLDQLLRSGRVAQALIWSLIAWIMVWIQFGLALYVFGESGSLVVSLFVCGVIAFGVALPSSPGAIGVYELSAIAGLLVFGYSREMALSMAVMMHLLQLILTSGFGAWALAREGRTILDLASKAQNMVRKQA